MSTENDRIRPVVGTPQWWPLKAPVPDTSPDCPCGTRAAADGRLPAACPCAVPSPDEAGGAPIPPTKTQSRGLSEELCWSSVSSLLGGGPRACAGGHQSREHLDLPRAGQRRPDRYGPGTGLQEVLGVVRAYTAGGDKRQIRERSAHGLEPLGAKHARRERLDPATSQADGGLDLGGRADPGRCGRPILSLSATTSGSSPGVSGTS